MSLATLAVAAAVLLAAIGVAVSLWRGAARQPWPDLRAYRWFTVAAGLICANVIVGQGVPVPQGTAAMLSFTDLPSLLLLPVMAAGLAGLASAVRREVPEAPSPRRTRRGLAAAGAYLADGYVLAAALFLIGWVTLFRAAYARSGTGLSFAGVLVHPLVDLLILWAALPLAQTAGRRGAAAYLALVAVTVGDSLAVGARIAGTRPGTAALAAQLVALVLLALTPWAHGAWAAGTWRLGGARAVTTAAAAAAAIVAGVLVVAQAITAGHLTGLMEILLLGTVAAVLGVRVVSLVWRVDSWSRVWRESGRQFRQLAEQTSDVVLLCDAGGVIRYASRAASGYGYVPDALRGTPVVDLLHPEDRAGGVRAIRRAMTSKAQRPGRYPCRVRAEDGTWRHVEATVSRYRDPGQPDLVLIAARDMSAQVALRRQVTRLTFQDGLTGLPNRVFAEQRAQDVLGRDRDTTAARLPGEPAAAAGTAVGESAVAAGTAVGESAVAGGTAVGEPAMPGFIVVDIDGFTAVNDTRGHTAGELLLAQVARRLRLAVSPEDTVARWGGDEFAVLTEVTVTAAELADIAERLVLGVAAQPFRIGDSDLSITASVGAALADGSPAAVVWRNAETALAQAKAAGGARAEMFRAGGATGAGGQGPAPAEAAASRQPGAA